jgi:hypothetical protein
MNHSYIIRFPDEASRSKFREALEGHSDLQQADIKFGEFFPDVIVRGISDEMLAKIRRIAHPKARFFEDFEHHLTGHDHQVGDWQLSSITVEPLHAPVFLC